MKFCGYPELSMEQQTTFFQKWKKGVWGLMKP